MRYRVLSLFILGAALCNAGNDTIRHVLATMNVAPRQITFTDGNTKGITSLLTYTCSGGADFGVDLEGNKAISLRIPNRVDAMYTTTALEELKGIIIKYYYYPSTRCNTIAVEVSRDSVDWETIVPEVTHLFGEIRATFPRRTNYVRVRNTDTSERISILEFWYIFEHCNCFEYIP